ncbi:decarboxylating 6-phosphogluconate dehydrogenase [Verticiella sediminum]|uniref:Decarboxylating 6-phosphogluconate dehydrogenase n=1 Tax=Verticiella sediminum TaxID=1247510 RepID=A0A556ASA1_9BURK|nr:decarboxylating 6-phosphogluconate dehydrogenase [Verticiella sediminum]TSH95822.1 decarboxylating 6-phosphogluconate dehydrogenase [Verticiella sediminum]
MQIGMIGLGRMGANLVRRLLRHGHTAVVHDANPDTIGTLAQDGAQGASGLDELVAALPAPRVVWVMLPAGAPTEDTITRLGKRLEPGDTVIDGGNTFYKDDVRRAAALRARGIDYLDIGTSGGVHGLERGYCLMIGGPDAAVRRLDPLFAALAPGGEKPPAGADPRPAQGYVHVGPAGAGHYAKMVHNGIEYGMMQALAEGLHLLHAKRTAATDSYDIDVAAVAQAWRRGSVVSSWLLDLAAEALTHDGELTDFAGAVGDSGEGRWTVDSAVEHGVPVPVLAAALFARFRSQQQDSYADRVLSALRHGFGGHGLGVRR